MSEPTLQLPSELKYGYVEAQIILAVADTAADPDRLPDAQPASGTITLTPVESKRLYTESGPPVLVGKHSITGTLDSQGRLRDSQGGLGICVVVGQYNVSYSLQGISVDSHPILVTEDHTKDEPLNLVDLVPFDPPATPGQFELLNARIDAESVIDKAPVVVLTNPEEIPTDVAGRIDLVFTEPTTVHFQSPVRTDIVVSIEGYEHITWSGVIVHGTPNSTGVVWASAMWRDRDSTWHLLCEQDASQVSGGNVRIHRWTTPLEAVRDKSPQVLDSRGFVQQEAYKPFPVDLTYGEVVVDLENPAGGAPIVSYVNVPVMGSGGPGSAFTPVSTAEAVFRTPDNASYLKFSVINCKIRGDVYVLSYTVKIKGSPFREDTSEQFDHPSLAALDAPGCGSFVIADRFDIPGFSPSTSARPSLTISRPPNPASQAPYIRVSVPPAPTTSFAEEVTVTRSIEGHVSGSGRTWSAT